MSIYQFNGTFFFEFFNSFCVAKKLFEKHFTRIEMNEKFFKKKLQLNYCKKLCVLYKVENFKRITLP